MGQIRAKTADEMRRKGYGFYSFIHPSVNWYGDSIGEGNIILENVTFCLNSKLGNFNIFFNNCALAHDTSIGDFNHFGPCIALSGHVRIGNHCFFGTNSTLRNDINVADYTLVGAGTYVNKSTQPYSVIVPAGSSILNDKSSLDVKI
jgi:acetyltransferase-like isoleucine patch superfamily enzyme